MHIVRTPLGMSEVGQINRVRNPRLRVDPPTKRIESDHYSNTEMELYLYFQNLGKYPTENPLK